MPTARRHEDVVPECGDNARSSAPRPPRLRTACEGLLGGSVSVRHPTDAPTGDGDGTPPPTRTSDHTPPPGGGQVNPTDLPTAEVAVEELLERSSERGYVLLSELQELYVPELHGDRWVEDAIVTARDHGVEVVDDVADDAPEEVA